VGNIPDLHRFHQIHAQVLHRPAPLLEIFSNTLHPNLPSTIIEWKHAQDIHPDFLQALDPDTIATCNGLSVYKDKDFPSRILVPPLSATNSHANTTTISSTLPTPKFLPRYPATTFGHQ
jgi:hypothetical protein